MKTEYAFNEKSFIVRKMLFLWHKQRLFSLFQTFYAEFYRSTFRICFNGLRYYFHAIFMRSLMYETEIAVIISAVFP